MKPVEGKGRQHAYGYRIGNIYITAKGTGYNNLIDLLWGDGGLSWMDESRFADMWSESGYWTLFFVRED